MSLALVAAVVISGVNSQAPSTPDAMRAVMHEYFSGELAEGWAFGGLGVAGLGAGTALLFSNQPLHRGAAVPLLGVGLLQLALAVGLRLRTPGQVAHFDEGLGRHPDAYSTEERARMQRVNRGFPVYAGVEIGLFFSGIALAGIGGVNRSDFAVGSGLTLALEAAAMLVLDHLAALRGQRYESALLGFRF